MLQITITDPTNREREIVRELLDIWPSDECAPVPESENTDHIVTTVHEEAAKFLHVDPSVFTSFAPGVHEERVPLTPDHGLDKDGLPWDERIHSGNHQLTQDGYWRKRRGVTEDQVAGVESELRGTPPPPPPVVEPANPMGAFIAFVGRVMAAIGDKTLTQAQVDEACRKHDVSSLAALGQKTDLVATIEGELFPQ